MSISSLQPSVMQPADRPSTTQFTKMIMVTVIWKKLLSTKSARNLFSFETWMLLVTLRRKTLPVRFRSPFLPSSSSSSAATGWTGAQHQERSLLNCNFSDIQRVVQDPSQYTRSWRRLCGARVGQRKNAKQQTNDQDNQTVLGVSGSEEAQKQQRRDDLQDTPSHIVTTDISPNKSHGGHSQDTGRK